ncbi:MAG TPA: type II secretion system F family protein [Rickettsiales bacterium]|nr:type II secretion system F family protein [Rickettsiales bacterium]
MNQQLMLQIAPLAAVFCILLFLLLWKSDRSRRIEQRIQRMKNRKSGVVVQKQVDALTLRRKTQEHSVPIIGVIISKLPTQAALKARLERAGLAIPTDRYVMGSAGVVALCVGLFLLTGKSAFGGIIVGVMLGVVVPHFVIGFLGGRRIKKFLVLFPDAIDFIVRGLRSGLPVTESMNIVGNEMAEPIRSIFSHIGESVRLGVPLDKALQDMARKLNSTEFNFFVTSIILQRETGGNLSEILNNLSDVLRKRLMMRLKIKAMSSEAKASAMIVGSLPFIVILALRFVSPGYLDPLIDTAKGNMIALGCGFSLALGIGIMIKMTKFEI